MTPGRAELSSQVWLVGLAHAAVQAEYETACVSLFAALDQLEQRLQGQRYLIPYYPGGQAGPPSPTLADYRLFATLIRFDVVYYLIFKTNIRHIRDYPNLQVSRGWSPLL